MTNYRINSVPALQMQPEMLTRINKTVKAYNGDKAPSLVFNKPQDSVFEIVYPGYGENDITAAVLVYRPLENNIIKVSQQYVSGLFVDPHSASVMPRFEEYLKKHIGAVTIVVKAKNKKWAKQLLKDGYKKDGDSKNYSKTLSAEKPFNIQTATRYMEFMLGTDAVFGRNSDSYNNKGIGCMDYSPSIPAAQKIISEENTGNKR